MNIKNYVEDKKHYLNETGLYKKVEFSSAIDVELSKNSTSESFLITHSNVDAECEEVLDLSSLPIERTKGSRITFDVLKNKKRKSESVKFYAKYK